MKKILLVTLVGIRMMATAQQRPKVGEWFSVNLPINLSGHWQWHNDAGYRTLGASIEPLQYLYRTGLRYNFNKRWNIAAGFAFFFTKNNFSKFDHEFGHESRCWEEINYQRPVAKNLQLLLRLRTEQRFFGATSTKSKYTGYRFRQRVGINQKLSTKWSLQLTNEYLRQSARRSFSFDQNRLTISGIYQLDRTSQVQAGYLWLKWPTDNQHILTLTFTKFFFLYGN